MRTFFGLFGGPRARRVCAWGVVVCLSAAACQSLRSTGPEPVPLVYAGDCLALEIRDLDDVAPDFNTRVACTEPHVYEVAQVLRVPARFLRGSTPDARLANRTLLGSVSGDTPLVVDFRKYAQTQCGPSPLERAGMGNITVAGKALKDVGAELVMGGATTWVNLSPLADWSAGRANIICSVRFTKNLTDADNASPSPISAQSDHPAFYDFLTDRFPADRRLCITYDSQERYGLNPCTRQHFGEMFFSYDAAAAFGKEFVKGVNVRKPSDAEWEKLGAPCADALPALLGDDLDKDITGGADFGMQGWFTKGTVYTTYCIAVPTKADDFDLPGGSLIGNAGKVKFIRISSGSDT